MWTLRSIGHKIYVIIYCLHIRNTVIVFDFCFVRLLPVATSITKTLICFPLLETHFNNVVKVSLLAFFYFTALILCVIINTSSFPASRRSAVFRHRFADLMHKVKLTLLNFSLQNICDVLLYLGTNAAVRLREQLMTLDLKQDENAGLLDQSRASGVKWTWLKFRGSSLFTFVYNNENVLLLMICSSAEQKKGFWVEEGGSI